MGNQNRPWDATFQRVEGVYSPKLKYPPTPSATDLDAVEKVLDFQFPASYRAFAEQFGLGGVLLSRARILSLTRPPWGPKSDRWSSVLNETRSFRANQWEECDWDAECPPSDFLKRVIVFAVEPGHHQWVFDPAEVTNAKLGEYRIYDVGRFDDVDRFVEYGSTCAAVATSFDQWLLQIDDRYNFDHDEERPEPEFRPVVKPVSTHPRPMRYHRDPLPRRKSAPSAAEVTVWLAWNNNAARALARAIRDFGRREAFPILADALQEAGCTNADLLDSCRTGDPDVDGAWVLQILLGRATN